MQETSDAVTATRAPRSWASSQALTIVLAVSGSSNKYPSTTSTFVFEMRLSSDESNRTVEEVP